MNCYMHPDRPAASFCRACGRALCTVCQRPAAGTVFCSEHLPAAGPAFAGSAYSSTSSAAGDPASAYAGTNSFAQNPYAQGQAAQGQAPFVPYASGAVPVQTSPGLAFLLGWIPGVGAIYNGQYIKGLVHAVIFGLIITLITANENGATIPFLAILLAAFVFYMPFEAFHTAKGRQIGMPVEEWSSLSRGPLPMSGGRTPIGPVILIGIGVLFLLDTMNLIEFRQIGRFWPVILIAVGASMLYSRLAPGHVPYGQVPGAYPPGTNMPPQSPSGMATAPSASAPATESGIVETGHE